MQFKTKFKDYSSNIWNNYKIIGSSILKNLRTYLYMFIIPLFIMTLIFLYQYNAMATEIRLARLISFMQIPAFMLIFLVNVTIAEWKDSVFLKRIHSAGVSKVNFLLSMSLFIFTIGLASSILGFCYILFFGKIFLKSIDIFNQLTLVNFGGWVGIIFGICMTIAISITLGIITSGLLKSVALSQSVTTIIIIVSLIFSDNFLDPEAMAKNTATAVFSYFIPYKYSVWTSFLFGTGGIPSFIFSNDISKVRIHLSFGLNSWAALFGGLGWLTLLSIGSHFSFGWSSK